MRTGCMFGPDLMIGQTPPWHGLTGNCVPERKQGHPIHSIDSPVFSYDSSQSVKSTVMLATSIRVLIFVLSDELDKTEVFSFTFGTQATAWRGTYLAQEHASCSGPGSTYYNVPPTSSIDQSSLF